MVEHWLLKYTGFPNSTGTSRCTIFNGWRYNIICMVFMGYVNYSSHFEKELKGGKLNLFLY